MNQQAIGSYGDTHGARHELVVVETDDGGFADPSGWKCSARYCEAWRSCPGGAGL